MQTQGRPDVTICVCSLKLGIEAGVCERVFNAWRADH
jgi:hypothetical protein